MFENICRICLQRKDTLFSLFRKIKGSSPYEKLLKKTCLNIHLNDSGPSSICSQCLMELDTTVIFLDKCENSNLILSTQLKSSDNIDGEERIFECKDKDDSEFLIAQASDSRVDGLKTNEKPAETVEDEREEMFFSQTPAAAAPARCPQCGSLSRCRHWAPPATHICHHCQKVFTRKFNFQLHLKRHLGERDWPCPSCGVKLLTRGLAQRHCEPRKRRVCPVPGCGKSFTTNTNLNTHLRVHNGERPHVCVECGKSFTSKNTLNAHLRIHTGAKPYICPVCGKQFTTNKLSAHLRTHSGSRPHACPAPACARAFPSRRALRLHAATHAPPARAHACPLCPAAYNHTQSLRKHTRQRHSQNIQD